MLAKTSPTSGDRSVDIVRSRTQVMGFVSLYENNIFGLKEKFGN
jgi:hypothetical protein